MKKFLLVTLLLLCGCAQAQQAPRPIRVLTIAGDWKAQAWYQDVRMGGKVLRGRYIAREVEKAAPGQFQFTDINAYIGQQYGDEDFFNQFDVVLVGDIIGWSLPPRFHDGLRKFVERGGGFIYCGSYKWHMTLLQNTPFEDVLPARFPADGFRDDWKLADVALQEFGFQPQLALDHPVTRGLDWANVPILDASGKMLPREGAQILLKTPKGAPLLAAWQFGGGRALFSSAIFANDEASFRYEDWKDFGKYYSQAFAWLGANRVGRDAPQEGTVENAITVDATRTSNEISPKHFSIHGSHNNPGLVPLEGLPLENYQRLNLDGGWTRVDVPPGIEPKNDNDDPNALNDAAFNWTKFDAEMEQIARLKLEPVLMFPFNYGHPEWMWGKGKSWPDATQQSADELAEFVIATLAHMKQTSKLPVRYIEILNEPNVNDKNMDAFVLLVRACARRVHREFPGVEVGAFGNHETPYLKTFLKKINPDLDWIASHPYGWTGEEIFRWQDHVAQFQKENNLRALPWFITEWDFWIQGRDKFDYVMLRNFQAVRRENLIGTIHFRLGQYAEKQGLDPRREAIYLFGVLWMGYGPGAGAKGEPMHDAYDGLWLFRDFRGTRAQTTKRGTPSLHADAVKTATGANLVLYNDWSGQKQRVAVRLMFAPSPRARTMTISRANGEGFEILPQTIAVAANVREVSTTLDIEPRTGLSLTVK